MTLPTRDSLNDNTIPMLKFYAAIKFSHRSLHSSVQVEGSLFLMSPVSLAITSLFSTTSPLLNSWARCDHVVLSIARNGYIYCS